MAIPLSDYEKIFAQMPKGSKGDQLHLTDEDEAALDRAWAKLAEKRRREGYKLPLKEEEKAPEED